MNRVRLAATGREFGVEEGQTILEAALAQRVNLPYTCMRGECGTCKRKVVSGRVELRAHDEGALSGAQAREGWILTCSSTPLEDVVLDDTDLAARAEPKEFSARVEEILDVASGIARLKLRLPLRAPMHWEPGQYLEAVLPDGKRRRYSMAHPQKADASIELYVRRLAGGVFSDGYLRTLEPRSVIRVHGPHGGFRLSADDARPTVMVAGGTGIAPVKAMLEALRVSGSRRRVTLYWGMRNASDFFLDALFRDWAAQGPQFGYVPVLSGGADPSWNGRLGLVHEAVLEDHPSLEGFEAYACGAPPMVAAVRETFAARGCRPEAIYTDAFLPNA